MHWAMFSLVSAILQAEDRQGRLAQKAGADYGHEERAGLKWSPYFPALPGKMHSQDEKQRWQGAAGSQICHGYRDIPDEQAWELMQQGGEESHREAVYRTTLQKPLMDLSSCYVTRPRLISASPRPPQSSVTVTHEQGCRRGRGSLMAASTPATPYKSLLLPGLTKERGLCLWHNQSHLFAAAAWVAVISGDW